jgi:3-hydroxymyristoyl/3-hydroxydecanoyl-(acyl carrier protein) dehydratase
MSDFEWGPRTALGDRIAVELRVPEDLKYFEGHFPGDPIVPGVAQLAAMETAIAREFPELGPPTGVQKLKFMSALRPGDSLVVTLARKAESVEIAIARGDTLCTSASFRFKPRP